AQGLEADAVDRWRQNGALLGLGVVIGHARNPTRNVRQGVYHPAAAREVSHPSAGARRHRPATDILSASIAMACTSAAIAYPIPSASTQVSARMSPTSAVV